MESFFQQYNSSDHFDSFLVPYAASSNISSLAEEGSIVTAQTCFNPSPTLLAYNEPFGEIPCHSQIHESRPLGKSYTVNIDPFAVNPSSVTPNQEPNSLKILANETASPDQITQTLTSMAKRRKNVDTKVEREDKHEKGKERRIKSNSKKQKIAPAEAPSGYVHVRARRGEATDSHSLAERVRRAKLNAKMKLLQSLVPGCDEITGKAQILEHIIKYVQTLQTQIEVLAAKLASTPMYNDFELNFNTNPYPQEDNGNWLWGTDEYAQKQEIPCNQYGFDNLLFH